MGVFIEPPVYHGWIMRGRMIKSSHLITDEVDLTELHRIAYAGGMKRSWFQDHADHPHYDITESRYAAMVRAGAIPVDRNGLVAAVRRRRAAVAGLESTPATTPG